MRAAARPGRGGELGRFRVCCGALVLAVLVVLCAAVLVMQVRLTGTPALGATPVGPDDGGSPLAIASKLGDEAVGALLLPGAPGATVLVSERDLSTIAATQNPDPHTFTQVQVRTRGGQLWVTADTQVGPLPVVVTAKLTLTLQPGGTITSDIREIDVGDQAIPGFMRSAIDPRGAAVFSLSSLLSASQLENLGLECLAVVPQRGIELGFHPPQAKASPGYCAAHPSPPAGSAG